MAVDYAHPVLTDVYAASGGAPDWPSYIRDNFTAMGTMFEGLDPAGKTVGFKRVTAGGLFQRWNGTAWVNFPLAYFPTAGGAIGGSVYITANPPPQLILQSGSATVGAYVAIGRTAYESYIGISGVNGGITTGDAPGEMTVRAENRLWLSSGAAGMMRMDVGAGILARYSLQAVGDFLPVVASGIRLGISAGQPIIGWYYSAGAADNKFWDLYASPTALIGRGINDANTVAANWLHVNRNGITIPSVCFPQGNVAIGATSVSLTSVKLDVVGTASTGDTVSIRLFEAAGNGSLQMIRTHPGFTYAGVGGGEGWLYSQGASPLNIGPDGNAAVKIVTNGAVRATFSGTGLIGFGRVNSFGQKQIEVQGGMSVGFVDSECYRLNHDSGFISFYNSAGAVRRGYVQAAGNDFVWSSEANGNWNFTGGGVTRFYISNNGYVYGGDPGVAGNRVITAKEMSATGSSAILPGGVRMQWGSVTTTLGAGATVTFPSAFSTVLNLQATLNGGSGTGWVLRTFNFLTGTFQFNMDNWNTVGQGQQAYIWWFAIGT